jgi:NADPH-dependent 2,4-dienoyl-CoA reductase/sulfur reductase-like enzyme
VRPSSDNQYAGGPVNWRIITSLIPYLAEFRGRVALAMGFLLVAKLAGVAVPWALKLIVEHFEQSPQALMVVPVVLLAGYGLLRFSSVFFSELRDAVFARVAERAMRRISLRVFEHLHRLDLGFHLSRRTGGLARDIERGTSGVSFLLRFMVFNILPTLVEIGLIAAILLAAFSPVYALTVLGSVILYGAFSIWCTEWRNRFVRESNQMDNRSNTRAVDSLLNYETVKYFGAEPHPNYNRIMLSPVLAGEQAFEDIVLNDLDWYRKNGITLHMGRKVERIDRIHRCVIADDGSSARYDRLLLATGSNPFMLPVPGNDLDGVISYRDIADTRTMMETARTHRHAVVIGGGLLGLEAANGLMLRGMDVTVVHIGETLLERQLDTTAGGLLQRSLEQRGLKFLLPKFTSELIDGGNGRVSAVRFKDGSEIPADLVVMAAGVRPNTELAESAGLACNRGILVNDTLQTFDPRIYAIGECVAHRGVAYGLVAPLYEQARVCANHLAMLGYGRYEGSVTSTKLKVTGIDLFSAGDFMGDDNSEIITLSNPIDGVYKKLVIRNDVLVGACLYGDTSDGGWYFDLIKEEKNISSIRDGLMFGAEIIEFSRAASSASASRQAASAQPSVQLAVSA